MVHMWCTFLTSVWPWPQYQNYIFTMNLSLARLSLFFKIGIENFGIKVCVPSWPLYDLDLWPICGWRGYPQWVFLSFFILLLVFILLSKYGRFNFFTYTVYLKGSRTIFWTWWKLFINLFNLVSHKQESLNTTTVNNNLLSFSIFSNHLRRITILQNQIVPSLHWYCTFWMLYFIMLLLFIEHLT